MIYSLNHACLGVYVWLCNMKHLLLSKERKCHLWGCIHSRLIFENKCSDERSDLIKREDNVQTAVVCDILIIFLDSQAADY